MEERMKAHFASSSRVDENDSASAIVSEGVERGHRDEAHPPRSLISGRRARLAPTTGGKGQYEGEIEAKKAAKRTSQIKVVLVGVTVCRSAR